VGSLSLGGKAAQNPSIFAIISHSRFCLIYGLNHQFAVLQHCQ
jgi:hypothetical protein